MNKNDFFVGQTVYLCNLGSNYADRFTNITQATVTKIGTKYVEIDKSYGKFSINDGYEFLKDYSPSKRIYLSLSDIESEQRSYELTRQIRDLVSKGGPILPLKLYDLELVVKILKGDDIDE